MSYCANCGVYNSYSDSFTESDSWTYDEDEMSIEEPMWHEPIPRSGLKRTAKEAGLKNLNERPRKKLRPLDDSMDVDCDIDSLSKQFNKMTLN